MTEDFISWALDSRRSLEERYFVKLLLEKGLETWRYKTSQPFEPGGWERTANLKKARKLNPAYRPEITRVDLERASPYIVSFTKLDLSCWEDRPIRNIEGVRFLPGLTSLRLEYGELTDLAPIVELPELEEFAISNVKLLEDYSPIALCRRLRKLRLLPEHPWPILGKLEDLVELEELTIGRNPWQIEDFGQRACYPKLLSAHIETAYPLRDASKLPGMPAIRYLALKTICRLDGLERYSSLEELTVGGSFQDADPVCDLPHLKHLTVDTEGLQDVSPLIRLPELRHLTVSSRKPRDYSPLVEAPKLREITATGDGAQVNEMELVAINAGLSLWDEDFALPEPRPYQGPLHIICFDDTASLNEACRQDYGVQSRHDQPYDSEGMKKAEAEWFERELGRIAEATLGPDWRKKGGHTNNSCVWISQFADAERIPELLEALRPLTAKSRIPRTAAIFVSIDSDEEHEWEDRPEAVERYEDEVSYEQRRAEQLDMLERQYRFQLRQQTEKDIDPESFSQPLVEPKPVPMPLEMLLLDDDSEDEFADDDDGEDEDDGEISSVSMNCCFQFDQNNVYMEERDLHLSKYLLGRVPDEFRGAKKEAKKKAAKQTKKKRDP